MSEADVVGLVTAIVIPVGVVLLMIGMIKLLDPAEEWLKGLFMSSSRRD